MDIHYGYGGFPEIGLPPVIIHFRLGFSLSLINHEEFSNLGIAFVESEQISDTPLTIVYVEQSKKCLTV